MRNKQFKAVFAACASALALMTGTAFSAGVGGQQESRAPVNDAFDVAESAIVTLDVGDELRQSLDFSFTLDGEEYDVSLNRTSIRAETYRIRTTAPDGSLVEAEPGPVRTYRGTIEGMPDVIVAGSLMRDGLHASIRFGVDEYLLIQPLAGKVGDAGENEYVLYWSHSVIGGEGVCGVNGEIADPDEVGIPNGGFAGPENGGNQALWSAELAVDCDHEFYQQSGSSIPNTEATVENLINIVNAQYEAECQITHELVEIIVRDSEPDPYTSTHAGTLLGQVADAWTSPPESTIARDVVQLFTGKNLNGGTIGIASLGTICDFNDAFGLSQVNWSPNINCKTNLIAHELGHNWSSGHCNCPGFTMHPVDQCANQFTNGSANQIISFRNAISSCLDFIPAEPPPASDLITPGDGVTGVDVKPFFQWTSEQDVDESILTIGTSPGLFNPDFEISTSQNSYLFITEELDPATTYYWKVVNVNNGGMSDSETFSFTTELAAPLPPELVSPADGATGVATGPAFEWNESTGALVYVLRVDTDPALDSPDVQINTQETEAALDEGTLEGETEYFWGVEAINSNGQTDSPTWSFTTEADAPPPACAGDFTGDGVTDSADLNLILGDFGGAYDSEDLNLVLGDFGCEG